MPQQMAGLSDKRGDPTRTARPRRAVVSQRFPMIVENGQVVSGVVRSLDAPAPASKEPRGHVFLTASDPAGGAHVTFRGTEFGKQRPEALRINGLIFPLRASTAP